MKFKLTKNDAQEVLHKLWVLHDTPDLQESYNLTQKHARALIDSLPVNGGIWDVDAPWALTAVRAEMLNHVQVLRDQANDARSGNEVGQALRIDKLATRFERMFSPPEK